MKKIITVIFAAGLMLPVYASESKNETKKVCIDQKDKDGKVVKNKDGSNKQTCKEVKVHKKLEGTEVPGQKK